MTTDASPEKMMDAQIANEAENLARDHDNEFPITARILREAARRLSALAPAAAPNVGVVEALRKFTVYHFSDPEKPSCCILCDSEWPNGSPEAHKPDCLAALSASPAASADERTEFAAELIRWIRDRYINNQHYPEGAAVEISDHIRSLTPQKEGIT